MSDDLQADLVEVVERFNALDNAPISDFEKAWDEVSALIEARGLREIGGPFPDLLKTLLEGTRWTTRGACGGSGLVPWVWIAPGDIARPDDRCAECEGSGISRWERPER